jgi:hypothetical protein
MRHAGLALLLLGGGCLSQIIPAHQPDSQQSDNTPAPDLAQPIDNSSPDLSGPGTPDDGGVVSQSVQITLEGEAATLTAPMVAMADATALGGQYIVSPAATTGGKAVFTFTAPEDGGYYFWGRTIGPTANNNSFHFSLDTDRIDNVAPPDATCTIWDLPVSTTWGWARVNQRTATGNLNISQNLTAGSHMIYLNEREDSSQLDQIIVTNDPNFIPQ